MRPSYPTDGEAYAARLANLEGRWWKRWLDVQRPYRWYLQRLNLGFVLDVGCGIGRSLKNAGGQGVGVDINPHAIKVCRERGLTAYTDAEFAVSEWAKPGTFDSLVAAHVVEHMHFDEARVLLQTYLPFLKAGATVVLIAPQERGFASDPTHIESFNFAALDRLFADLKIRTTRRESFPLPRLFGHVFAHNEFVVVGKTQGA